jgi:hypothetical protein
MKITIENTDQIVGMRIRGISFPSRLWTGKTENGIDVYVLMMSIGVPADADQSQFEKELIAQPATNVETLEGFPLRMRF